MKGITADHSVILVQQCRSGKCGVDDNQRGLLLLLVLLDGLVVEHVLGEHHLNGVSLGLGVALPVFEKLNVCFFS